MTESVLKLSNMEYTISLAQGNYDKNMAFLLPSVLYLVSQGTVVFI